MIGMNLYVQEFASYPSINDLVSGLYPLVRCWWPSNNYNYFQSNPYLGPRTGIYACPAYNRLRAEFVNIDDPWLVGGSGRKLRLQHRRNVCCWWSGPAPGSL
jgi:hypothetical protein